MKHLILGVILALAACASAKPTTPLPPLPGPNQDPDVPPPLLPVQATTGDEAACARLRTLTCAEGIDAPCLRTFAHARTNESSANAGDTDKVSACVAGAADAVAVRACGSPITLRFDCAAH